MFFCPFLSTKDEKVPCSEQCALAVTREIKHEQEIRCGILQIALVQESISEKE